MNANLKKASGGGELAVKVFAWLFMGAVLIGIGMVIGMLSGCASTAPTSPTDQTVRTNRTVAGGALEFVSGSRPMVRSAAVVKQTNAFRGNPAVHFFPLLFPPGVSNCTVWTVQQSADLRNWTTLYVTSNTGNAPLTVWIDTNVPVAEWRAIGRP